MALGVGPQGLRDAVDSNQPRAKRSGGSRGGGAPRQIKKSKQMPRLIGRPTVVQAAGNKPKRIEEFAGRVNSGHGSVSVARMVSPGGWQEPGQRPEFEEITVVLRGVLRVEHDGGSLDVQAGQAVIAQPGEWVRYSHAGSGRGRVHRHLPTRVLP